MEGMVSWRQLEEEYRGKKVFLTGHTGFKGSWLMACLHLAGAEIKGYALPPEYENGLFSLLSPLPGVISCLADIRDRESVRNELLNFEPDYVFHLAAQPLVRRSYEIPAETFDINVTGTANLLQAVTGLHKPCVVVVITTDKVYENKESDTLYRETDILGGYDPYSASKACAELVVSSFRSSFFHPDRHGSHQKAIASARAGNVIGGGDWSRDRIIPDIVRSLLKDQPIEVRNPASVRPWQHVLEPVAGYLQLAALLRRQPDRYGKAYNFGPLPEGHLSVRELVETAIDIWGRGSWEDRSSAAVPHEAGLLKLDITLAEKELYWTPRLDARQAIQWALEWYRQPLTAQGGLHFSTNKILFFRMIFTATSLAGAFEIGLEPFSDERGWFARFYCKKEFEQIGHTKEWVQLNQSVTYSKGAIRGMHFQHPPFREIKLVRCIAGAVYDVIIDLRQNSPTFLQWYGAELSARNNRMLYIPEGFAHGFQTLEENSALIYHHTEFYSPGAEGGFRHDDPAFSILWPLPVTIISERDSRHPLIDNHFKGI